ncbi:hypothetical protein K9N50_09665 [bacterium]|nr:hypothetical protein [bacterium]
MTKSFLIFCLLLLMLIVCQQGLYAQPDTLWTKMYNVEPFPNICNSLSTPDDGFILPFNDYLMKLDSHGDTQWTVRCKENAKQSSINAITINTSNEIIVIGNAVDTEKWNWIGVVSVDGELLSLNRIGDRRYGICQSVLSFESNISGVFYDSELDYESNLFRFHSLPTMEIVTFNKNGGFQWDSQFDFTSGLGNYLSPLMNPVCFEKHTKYRNRILFIYNLRDFELPEWDLYDPHAYIKPRRTEYQDIMERSAQDTLLLCLTFLDEKGIFKQPLQIDKYEKLFPYKLDGVYKLSKRFWFCWEERENWLTFIENRLIKGERDCSEGYQRVTKLTNHLFFSNWDSQGRFVSEQKIDLRLDYTKHRNIDICYLRKLTDETFLIAGQLDVKRPDVERYDQDFFLMKIDRQKLIWFQHFGWSERNDCFQDLHLSGSDIIVVGMSDQWHSNYSDLKYFIMKIGPIN